MRDLAVLAAVIGPYVVALVVAGRRADRARGPRWAGVRPYLYALSLATLCSAWTYFGAVGDAAGGHRLFVASALGPTLAITLGYPMWRKLAVVCKRENVGSLADFMAARYGKSRPLGILCAGTAAVGALPYLALQLDILDDAWSFATRAAGLPGLARVSVLLPVGCLAAVPIAFGATRLSITRHNRGFTTVLAAQSAVKLLGLVAVGALGLSLVSAVPRGGGAALGTLAPSGGPAIGAFLTLAFLSGVGAFTLPRQFHLGFVAVEQAGDARVARWVLPLYLACWSAAALAIGAAARMAPAASGVEPQMQGLALPILHHGDALLAFAMVAGLSAGAATIAVEMIATGTMISNELVLPLLARRRRLRAIDGAVGPSILLVRRATMAALGVLAWSWYLGTGDGGTPLALGQTALAAFAQFFPALIGGLYWRRGHVDGALAGIAAGMLLWLATVAGPMLMNASPAGLGGGSSYLWPAARDASTELAIVLSLSVNALVYVVMSLLARPRLVDTIQAVSFVGAPHASPSREETPAIDATMRDVRHLLARFMGEREAALAMRDLRAALPGEPLDDEAAVTPALARQAETMLAGVIGAPSARNVVAAAIAAAQQPTAEIGRILDEAAHAVHFSRDLLQTTLESLSEGVGVVDRSMRMVAWNARYLDLLELPTAHVYVGKPLAELFDADRDRAEGRGVRHRLADVGDHIFRRAPWREEWAREDGRIVLGIGKPLEQGEYLTTLTDISDLRAAERVLAQDNEALEQRVRDRTRELSAANAALGEATRVAERATVAQKRFVAAASHDLVQPLHAARLFIGNVLPAVEADTALADMLQRADQAVDAAHGMMRALLHLSRLETGAVDPDVGAVPADTLLRSLHEEYAPEARARGIGLVVRPTRHWVRTDRDLLRSMLQNLIGNALRYTPSGRILVAVRPAGDRVRFEVRDTGVGISPERVAEAFGEYSRLPEGRSLAQGAGLGLAIVGRIAQVLDHPVTVRSRPGAGSVFSFVVPVAAPVVRTAPSPAKTPHAVSGLRVLCIDDEHDVLLGTSALIERWGCIVDAAPSAEHVADLPGPWDVVIADNQLPGESGVDLLRRIGGRCRRRILLTATAEDGWDAALAAEGIHLLRKPVAPMALRALLATDQADEARLRVIASS